MKKKWIPVIVIGCILVVLIIGVYLNNYIINDPSFMSSINTTDKASDLNYLGSDVADNHYYIYMSNETFSQMGLKLLGLDSSVNHRYLLKVNSAGKIKYRLHLEEDVGSIMKVVFDGDQNIYIWSQERDAYGIYVTNEKILKFDNKNGNKTGIYEMSYSDTAKPGVGSIRGLSGGKSIVFYYKENDKVYANRYDGEINVERVITWDVNEVLMEVLGSTVENTLLISKSSKVYSLSGKSNEYNVGVEIVADFLGSDNTIKSASVDEKGNILIETLMIDKEIIRMYSFSKQFKMISLKDEHPWEPDVSYKGVIDQVNKLTPESGIVGFGSLIWIMFLGVIGIFVYGIYYYYVYILQQKNPLVLKLLLAAIPIVVIGMIIYIRFNYLNTYVAFKDELEKSKYIAFNEAIDGKLLEIDEIKGKYNALGEIIEKYDYSDHDHGDYLEIEALTQLPNGEGTPIEGTYYVIDKVLNGESFKLMDADLTEKIMSPRYVHSGNEMYFKKAIAGKTINGKTGAYIFTIRPIYNADNEVVGLFQVGMNYGNYQRKIEEKLLYGNLQRLSIITGLMILIMGVTIYLILRPIGSLTRAVRTLSEDQLEFDIEQKTNDEIGELTKAFQYITNTLKEFISRIRTLNQAYYRFVPEEFFSVLDKKSVIDVELGDNKQLNMCIMNASISNFYEVSEQFEKEEHFNYVNRILSLLAPQIRNNLGFVDRYLDRGAVGLFSNRGHHAIDAAVEMIKEFYNQEDLKDIFKLNVGIHRGDLLMGIIGEEERLQSIVLSDDVTITSQLQELADYLNISVLITEEVFSSTDEDFELDYRSIGKVVMKNRKKPLNLYDVYEGDESQVKYRKSMTLKDFKNGLKAYEEGRFYDARSAFIKVLSAIGDDNISKAYFYLSDQYYREGSPEDWEGILDLNLVRFDLEG